MELYFLHPFVSLGPHHSIITHFSAYTNEFIPYQPYSLYSNKQGDSKEPPDPGEFITNITLLFDTKADVRVTGTRRPPRVA